MKGARIGSSVMALVVAAGVMAVGGSVAMGAPKPAGGESAKPADPKPADSKPADPKPADAKAGDGASETKAEAPVDPDQAKKDAAEKVRLEAEAAAKVPVLSYTMKTIDGKDQPLAAYQGKVLLIVNTASRCGFTAQYTGLEKLYQDFKGRGFEILAFPANNFGGQEPGSNEEIKAFCTGADSKYKVTFPIFSKISVTGQEQHPLYATLAAQPSPIGGDPKWNFTKFLVDRDGKVVARFESRIRPDDPELLRQLRAVLDQEPKGTGSEKPDAAGSAAGAAGQ